MKTVRTRAGRTSGLVLAAACAAVLLGGCGMIPGLGSSEPTATKQAQEEQSEQSQGAADGQEKPADQQAGDQGGESSGQGKADESVVIDEDTKAAGVKPLEVGPPTASVTRVAHVHQDPSATLAANLHSRERRDKIVTITASFTVKTSHTDRGESLRTYLSGHPWSPYLIDAKNLNKHNVLGNGEAQTDEGKVVFSPGQTMYAYASFAAPPEDVTVMDVVLVEGAPVMKDVKITG